RLVVSLYRGRFAAEAAPTELVCPLYLIITDIALFLWERIYPRIWMVRASLLFSLYRRMFADKSAPTGGWALHCENFV
ncbi:MAG: hypothetical protein KKD01_18880, partial [Proteobacteria bacterium]|nr:hypothetical protein [Pseudomonadota bacterium]MBU1456787.1 hypothetical protein [Pseudomonadota bacterium]